MPFCLPEHVITGIDRDPVQPVFERGFAAKRAQTLIYLDEDLLAEVFELEGITRKTGGQPKDVMFVSDHQIGKAFFFSLWVGYDVLLRWLQATAPLFFTFP